MKIWYQAMAREQAWGGYHAFVNQHLERIKSPDTVIEVHGLTRWGGVADQFSYLEYVGGVEVLDNVQTAMRRGFDAFVIGNIADPALREAREIANIPVLGLCESTCHVACLMGGNFAFVTLNEKFIPRVVDNVDRYGLRSRFVRHPADEARPHFKSQGRVQRSAGGQGYLRRVSSRCGGAGRRRR